MSSLRERFFQEIDWMARNIPLDQKVLSITAPTGIGKTLAGLNAALVLRERISKETGRVPRIIYALPLTSIIDQNYEVLREVFERGDLLPDNYLVKHHHLAKPPGLPENASLDDYEKAATTVETWDAEIIVTTFVQVFETLFTNRRSNLRKLHRLAGSILILDEVQNIPPRYWLATEEILKEMARIFDTRVVLMTATQPALLEGAYELVQNKDCFFGQLNRTELLLKAREPVSYKQIKDWLLPEIQDSKSFLVVMNTIKSSQEVYERLKEILIGKYELLYLSASLIPKHREERIQKIKSLLDSGKNVGVVSTQAIEAGVDLDFEVVIRDMAPLDSVIQAAGRCNRNMSEKRGKVLLVNLKDDNRPLSSYIYDSVLLSATKDHLDKIEKLGEEDYSNVVHSYFREIRNNRIRQDKGSLENAKKLNYKEVAKFSLIEERPIYRDVFVEYDDEARELIQELKKIEKLPSEKYKDRKSRHGKYERLKPKLRKYIVSVPESVLRELGLNPLPYLTGVLCLESNHPQFRDIYLEETGFIRCPPDEPCLIL